MVIADDGRRYLAANSAACLLLRLPEDQLTTMRIEDLVSPDSRSVVASLWESFLAEGTQKGTIALAMPDGPVVEVDYSATANVQPGRHLAIWMFPPGNEAREVEPVARPLLTDREREVLTMVAMGMSSSWIALTLGVATSTVESHVRNCLEKLGARNRAHAIALGISAGEVTLDFDGALPRR